LGLRYSEESKEVDHVLDKNFTGGWDYSELAALPPGSLAFGDTAEEYDRFTATPGLETPIAIAEGAIYADALGTWEHEILDRKRDEDFTTWSITLEQDVGDDAMMFATVSTGVKGGGFDGRFLRATDDDQFFEYDEEKAMNYELGFKSTVLDGAMTLNAAVFFVTVEDFQVSIFDGATAFFVQNAAEIESKGVELDMRWAATDNLTVGFAGTFLDNEYSDFPNAPCWSGTAENNRGNCIGRDTADAYRDASGDRNMFSPEWAYNLNLDYFLPLGDNLEGRATLNVNYSDEYFTAADLDPVYAYQEDYTKVDLRLALGSADGTWEVALLGKNLTDEYVSANSNDQPLVAGNGFAFTDRLRSYAVQGTYRF
jgi:outer membrane receptor protein involved in Fe transport